MEEPLSPALGPSAPRNYPHKYTISKGCNCLHAYGHSCLISFSISLDFPGTITRVRRTSGPRSAPSPSPRLFLSKLLSDQIGSDGGRVRFYEGHKERRPRLTLLFPAGPRPCPDGRASFASSSRLGSTFSISLNRMLVLVT